MLRETEIARIHALPWVAKPDALPRMHPMSLEPRSASGEDLTFRHTLGGPGHKGLAHGSQGGAHTPLNGGVDWNRQWAVAPSRAAREVPEGQTAHLGEEWGGSWPHRGVAQWGARGSGRARDTVLCRPCRPRCVRGPTQPALNRPRPLPGPRRTPAPAGLHQLPERGRPELGEAAHRSSSASSQGLVAPAPAVGHPTPSSHTSQDHAPLQKPRPGRAASDTSQVANTTLNPKAACHDPRTQPRPNLPRIPTAWGSTHGVPGCGTVIWRGSLPRSALCTPTPSSSSSPLLSSPRPPPHPPHGAQMTAAGVLSAHCHFSRTRRPGDVVCYWLQFTGEETAWHAGVR